MAYGIKRGIKAPGEFGVSDVMGFALAGSAGIIAALVTDFQQKGEASALFTINQWVVALSTLLGISEIPLWVVALGLIMVGAGSIFYFQPITRHGAFAQGFGLLAVLMTAIPPDLAGGLEAISDDGLPGIDQASFTREASLQPGIINAAYSPSSDARIVLAQNNRRQQAKYEVNLRVTFPNGLPEDIDAMMRKGTIRGRLHNEGTAQTWNLFRSAGGTIERRGNTLHITAGVPARDQSARIWVRIEAMGYLIEEQSAMARLDRNLDWSIEMTPSDTPLFIQRLNKSFWF